MSKTNVFNLKTPEVLWRNIGVEIPNSGVVLSISHHVIIQYLPQNHTNPFPQRSVILTTPGARHLCFYITPVEAIEPPNIDIKRHPVLQSQPLWAGPMPRNVHPFARLHVPTSCDPARVQTRSLGKDRSAKTGGLYPE